LRLRDLCGLSDLGDGPSAVTAVVIVIEHHGR
jgi:hypothetical protein